MAASWGYKTDNGPSNWHKWYPVASEGTRQSPIDIVTLDVDGASEEDPSLVATYEPTADLAIENTGASWMVKLAPVPSSLKGGPLDPKDEYKVLQMHAHWGSVDGQGSEHTVNGVSYSAELHIVHYNTKYKTPENAVDKPDGLAVLGMFLKIGDAHPELEKVCEMLEDIKVKGQGTVLKRAVDPDQLLPENRSFYTYLGSLTTPPLFESVTWIVFEQPIEISKEQLEEMRDIREGSDRETDRVVDNFRPPCCQGQRRVKKF